MWWRGVELTAVPCLLDTSLWQLPESGASSIKTSPSFVFERVNERFARDALELNSLLQPRASMPTSGLLVSPTRQR